MARKVVRAAAAPRLPSATVILERSPNADAGGSGVESPGGGLREVCGQSRARVLRFGTRIRVRLCDLLCAGVRACVCVRMYAHVRVRVRLRACVRACARACAA